MEQVIQAKAKLADADARLTKIGSETAAILGKLHNGPTPGTVHVELYCLKAASGHWPIRVG